MKWSRLFPKFIIKILHGNTKIVRDTKAQKKSRGKELTLNSLPGSTPVFRISSYIDLSQKPINFWPRPPGKLNKSCICWKGVLPFRTGFSVKSVFALSWHNSTCRANHTITAVILYHKLTTLSYISNEAIQAIGQAPLQKGVISSRITNRIPQPDRASLDQ